jgi:hypothetical protein
MLAVLHGPIEFTSVTLDPSPNLSIVNLSRIEVCQKRLLDQSQIDHQGM